MLDLIKLVVGLFAEKKSEIIYDVQESENTKEVTIYLANSDMGKVIGAKGKLATALRTLVKDFTPKDEKRYVIEIKELSEWTKNA